MRNGLPCLGLALLLVACRQDMNHQARYEPLKATEFFPDQRTSRPLPAHTVARGDLREDTALYTGHLPNGEYVNVSPLPVTADLLKRGQERFNIYCSVCHGRTGLGDGMIVQRGFPHPPAYTEERLRNAPLGYFFNVITNGYGVMYSYAQRVEPEDRWAIAAYIRVLQLSEHATLADATPQGRTELEAQK